ncbi:MAG TPA: hypothetical protein VFE65_07710 [Pseudonocardia sp.]|nr:hypothetical protein [Pseudonocardia sp.]
MIDNSVGPAMAARLGASLPAELIDRLIPYLTAELLGGLADLATDLHLRPMVSRGGGQHAITLADI